MAAALLGGLHDDVAAIEPDGLAAPGGFDGKLGALVQLHTGAVGKLENGMRAGRGANGIPVGECRAGLQGALGKAVERAGNGDDGRAGTGRRECGIDAVAAEIERAEDDAGGDGPAGPAVVTGRADLRHCDDFGLALRFSKRSPAFGAAAQVVVKEETAGCGELAGKVGAELRPELGASH